MMCVAVKLLLLLAAVGCWAAPGPEDCDGLNFTLSHDHMNTIFGDWVLVWSTCDNQQSSRLLSSLSSSHLHIHRLTNTSALLLERNLFRDQSCVEHHINMEQSTEHQDHYLMKLTKSSELPVEDPANPPLIGVASFFKTSDSDSMTFTYRGLLGHFLLTYMREGHHTDLEQLKASYPDYQKLAECLGIPHDKPFTYDGAAGFCPPKAPEVKAD